MTTTVFPTSHTRSETFSIGTSVVTLWSLRFYCVPVSWNCLSILWLWSSEIPYSFNDAISQFLNTVKRTLLSMSKHINLFQFITSGRLMRHINTPIIFSWRANKIILLFMGLVSKRDFVRVISFFFQKYSCLFELTQWCMPSDHKSGLPTVFNQSHSYNYFNLHYIIMISTWWVFYYFTSFTDEVTK